MLFLLLSWFALPLLAERRAALFQAGTIPPEMSFADVEKFAAFVGLETHEFCRLAHEYRQRNQQQEQAEAEPDQSAPEPESEPEESAEVLTYPELPAEHWKNRAGSEEQFQGVIVDLPPLKNRKPEDLY
jgi:hypothetical protein